MILINLYVLNAFRAIFKDFVRRLPVACPDFSFLKIVV